MNTIPRIPCGPWRPGRSRNSSIAICTASNDRAPIFARISVFFILFILFMVAVVVVVVAVVMMAIMLVIVVMVMIMIMVVIVFIFVVVITDMAVVLHMHLILVQIFPILGVLIVRRQTGRRWIGWKRNRFGCFFR